MIELFDTVTIFAALLPDRRIAKCLYMLFAVEKEVMQDGEARMWRGEDGEAKSPPAVQNLDAIRISNFSLYRTVSSVRCY